MKRRRRWLRWVVLAAVLGGGAALALRLWLGPRVELVPVSRRELRQTVVATGRVLVPARVQLGSTVLGNVAKVLVAEGARVRKGQRLLELVADEALAQVAQARAAVAQASARVAQLEGVARPVAREGVAQARAGLALAEAAFRRTDSLQRSGALPPAQLDDARKLRDVSRSQVRAAEVQLEGNGPRGVELRIARAARAQASASVRLAEAREALLRVDAPGDGVILTRAVEPGDVVQPGRVLLTLALDGPTWIVAQVDERNLAFLRTGQAARVSADAFAAQSFAATVAWLGPAVDPLRGTLEVRLSVARPPDYLRPEMTVSLEVEVGRLPGVLALPAEAVRDAASRKPWVLVLDGDHAARREVTLGLRGEGWLELVSGLEAGAAVIPPRAGAIAPGRRVRPAEVP